MARTAYLSGLIPEDYLFWHSLDQPGLADTDAALVADEAGDVHLSATDPEPVWRNHLTGETYIDFNGSQNPLKSATGKNLDIKHLFVIASYGGASFANTAGLFTEATAVTNGILVGEAGSTKFTNFSFPSLEYRKSGALFAQSNMQAPMNAVELMEWKLTVGYDADSVQIGQDRADGARKWLGRFYGALAYDRVLSESEVRKIRLYAQLVTRNWLTLGETLVFPSPELIWGESTYPRFYRFPLDYDSVTDTHTYEDETKSFNETTLTPPQRWEVSFANYLTWQQAEILDAFWKNVRKTKPFNFYDYRRGEFYTDVRVESYDRQHEAHQSYKNQCRFVLVKYGNKPSLPYELIDDEIPTVTILTPAAAAVLNGSVTITVTATDNVGLKRVEYYLAREISPGVLENHQLGVSSVAPYSFTFDSEDYADDDWTITAQAVDTSDNYSLPSQVTISIDNTPEPDEEAPTLPSNALSLNGVPTTSIVPLKWLAGSDNVAVTGYRVTYAENEDFTSSQTKVVGNVLNTSITSLTAETDYWFYVQARDAAGNWSANSNVISAATAPAGTLGMAEGLTRENEGVTREDEGFMKE